MMGVSPADTNTATVRTQADPTETLLFVTGWQKPTDPTMPGPPKYTSVIPQPLPEDQARQDYIGSIVILSPEEQAQADGIIVGLKKDFGTPVDGAGAAAHLLDLEANGKASTDVLLYVINTVGGGLGGAIRATLLAGGESYLDSVVLSGTYSPLSNRVYAESPDHQSVYEGLRDLGGYEAIATLALLPPLAAYEAIQTWAQEDPAGLSKSLEELPDENVLDLVRYLKPIVAVRLLYQMERADLITELAMTQPDTLRDLTLLAFNDLVAQDEVANPERARGAVLDFHNSIVFAMNAPSGAPGVAGPGPVVPAGQQGAVHPAQAEIEQIVAGNFSLANTTKAELEQRLITLLSNPGLSLNVETQAKVIRFLADYLLQNGVGYLTPVTNPALLPVIANLGRNTNAGADPSTRLPPDGLEIQSVYSNMFGQVFSETVAAFGYDMQTDIIDGNLDLASHQAFVEELVSRFVGRWNDFVRGRPELSDLVINPVLTFSASMSRMGGFHPPTNSLTINLVGLFDLYQLSSAVAHELFHAVQDAGISRFHAWEVFQHYTGSPPPEPSDITLLCWISFADFQSNRPAGGTDPLYIYRHHESQAFGTEGRLLETIRTLFPHVQFDANWVQEYADGSTTFRPFLPGLGDLYASGDSTTAVPADLHASALSWVDEIEPYLDDVSAVNLLEARAAYVADPNFGSFGRLMSTLFAIAGSQQNVRPVISHLVQGLSGSEINAILYSIIHNAGSNPAPTADRGYRGFIAAVGHQAQIPAGFEERQARTVRFTLHVALWDVIRHAQTNRNIFVWGNGRLSMLMKHLDPRNLGKVLSLLNSLMHFNPTTVVLIRNRLMQLGPRGKEALIRMFPYGSQERVWISRFYDLVFQTPAAGAPPAGRAVPLASILSQAPLIDEAITVAGSDGSVGTGVPATIDGLGFDLNYTEIAIRDAWATLKADPSLSAELRSLIDALPADADVGQILAFLDAHQAVPSVANARDSLLDDPIFTQSVSTLRANDWGLDVTGRTVVAPDDSVHAGGTRETHYGVDADGKVYIAAEELADANGRVSQITYLNADGTVIRTTANTYDANGRPATTATTWADTGETRTETYSYDAAGQETGSTASITRRFGLDGQVQETGFYTYDADQQQIAGTERGFTRDGKLLFEVELAQDGSPARVISFAAGELDAGSLETFHRLIQDARASGNSAFLNHPGVRQLGAVLDLAQAMGLAYADLRQVDINNIGGAILGDTRLVEALEGVGAFPPGTVDAEGLSGLQGLFVTRVTPPSIGYTNSDGTMTQTAWTERTYQIINGEEREVSLKVYRRDVPTENLDPNNLPTDKEGAHLVTTLTSYDASGRVINTSVTWPDRVTAQRSYYIGDDVAFTIDHTGAIALPDGATWTPDRVELLQSSLQDFRLGNDPYLTLDAAGQEKIQLIDGVLQQAALYGITPQDFVNFDPNNLLETEISKDKFISFLGSLQGVDGVDQAAITTKLQELAAAPDIKTVRLLDYILAPANILTLGAADDARVIAQTLMSISKAAGGTILGKPIAEIGTEFVNDLIRNFDLLGDAAKSAKALKVLGPVVGLLFIGLDLYEGITAFRRHKAEGRSDLTLAYDVFLAMGGGPGGAITAAMHMKRENGGDPGEVALAFVAGLFGMYDPDNPGSTAQVLAQGLLALGKGLENFVKDPIGTLRGIGTAINDLIWSFTPKDLHLQVASNT